MSKILTISVAAYNVAPFIPKIVDEVALCKNKDLIEVIIVNDGSTDSGKTLAVANKYAELYKDIVKVIDKDDEGHGSTINAGLLVAKGKYFKPLDGDDWLQHEELEKLVDNMVNCNSDLIVCNHLFYYENDNSKSVVKMKLPDEKEYDANKAFQYLIGLQYHDVYYKTNILRDNNVKITEFSFYTDSEFLVYPIKYIKTVTRYDLTPYCYRMGQAGQSVSIKGFIKHEDEHADIFFKLLEFYLVNKDGWDEGRNAFIEELLAMLSRAHLRIYFFKKNIFREMSNAIKFDNIIREYPKIYNQYHRRTLIYMWRKNRIVLFIPLSILARLKEIIKSRF